MSTEVWQQAVQNVLCAGMYVCPRGIQTMELLNGRVGVNMARPLMMMKARKLSYKFAAAEALWIINGQNDLASLVKYAPSYNRFSDDGVTLFGAYGPPVRDQLSHVVGTLCNDSYSRQAVISIWRTNPGKSNDIPCTLSLQFLIRQGQLHCVASMRSSDVWLGLPYDIFSFTMITAYVYMRLFTQTGMIGSIERGLGFLEINAGSQHMYVRDIEKYHEMMKHPGILDIVDMSIHDILYPDHLKQCLGFVLDDPCYLVGVKIPPFFQQMREYAQTQA